MPIKYKSYEKKINFFKCIKTSAYNTGKQVILKIEIVQKCWKNDIYI